MARIRSIKPEFWTDEEFVAEHTRDERMFYAALLNYVFDNWCGYYLPRSIKRECFPFDDDLTVEAIETMMHRLADTGRIFFFTQDGRHCFYMPKAQKHQRVNRPTPSPITPPTNEEMRTHGGLSEDSVNTHSPRGRASLPLPSSPRVVSGPEMFKDNSDVAAVDNLNPLSSSTKIPDQVFGYWSDKAGRDAKPADLKSLTSLCKHFPPEVVNLAIGQAVAQGYPADNFALITTIAKAEVSR